MAYRSTSFVPQEFFHIYNRGTDKKVIFKDGADYRRFIDLLFLSNCTEPINVRDVRGQHQNLFDFDRKAKLVSIGAYCIMPNHFHILMTPLTEGALETFMRKLATGYSMYFNKRYERTGSLYEGRYKAKHADTDEYLKYLFAYIHLNPVKIMQPDWKEKGIVDREAAYRYASSFQYSSLPDHVGHKRKEGMILDMSVFPEYFIKHEDHKTDLFDWLDLAPE